MTGNTNKPKKNGLSILLTESAVFLRTDGPTGRPHRNPETRSSLVRGLMVLELAKPTKISSIELELVATASTAWPEGVGARRVEVCEKHQVHHASTVYYKANDSSAALSRRAASVGPGVSLALDDPTLDWEEEDVDDSFRQAQPSHFPTTSAGVPFTHSDSVGSNNSRSLNTRHSDEGRSGTSPLLGSLRTERRVSVDSHFFQRSPVSYHEELDVPIPPYSPIDPSPSSFVASPITQSAQGASRHELSSPRNRASQTLEDFRAELQSNLQNSQRSPSSSSALSLRSHAERSLSRHPSMSDVPENSQLHPLTDISPTPRPARPRPQRSQTPSVHSRSGSGSFPLQGSEDRAYPPHLQSDISNLSLDGSNESNTSIPRPPSASPLRHSPELEGSSPQVPPADLNSTREAGRQSSTSLERRGRNHSRFSLSAVADALRDAVRSTSPIATRFAIPSRERETNHHEDLSGPRNRDRSRDDFRARSRGRRMERPVSLLDAENAFAHSALNHPPGLFGRDPNVASFNTQKSKSRPRESITRVFGPTFEEVKEEKKAIGNGWKEFKKGTYTYPISFTIPSTAPPTLQCDYGSVVWKLYAHVHRPGAFKTKFTATREVQVIACPTEEDTEDTENIIVERHWDQQLQYLISISGRSFHIGGTMPVTFAFMPLAKVKIYRLAVFIEERVDYYNNMRRVVRSDPLSRFHLLSIKHSGKHHAPILPLESDDVDALESSPLYELLNPEDDPSEVASELMGPGPWSFHHDLKLPASCNLMHFTNKNRRANMTISHLLKVVIRVERGDDLHVDKSGKRKLFDIVVQTPVQILSCRCNPDWTSLPRYEETFVRDNYVLPNCPCQNQEAAAEEEKTPSDQSEIHLGPFHAHLPAALERMRSHHSNDNHNEGPSHDHSGGGSGHQAVADHPSPHMDSIGAPATVQAVHPSETSAIDPAVMRSLRVVTLRDPQTAEYLRSNQQFERLVSGFESEFGEAPPSYECVAPGPSSPAIVVN